MTELEAADGAVASIQRFLEANYPCACGADPQCPGEYFEAEALAEIVRPILHTERDAELWDEFAARFPDCRRGPVEGLLDAMVRAVTDDVIDAVSPRFVQTESAVPLVRDDNGEEMSFAAFLRRRMGQPA